MAKKEGAGPDKKIDDLYDLIDGIEVAMMTTRRADGQLVSRAMATQQRAAGADLWFVTDVATHKLEELETDPHINLSYYKDRTREWVSVSGTARIVQDRSRIEELYQPDWRMWFGDEGGKRDGGPGDPRMALIAVDADTVVYTKQDAATPVVLFEVAKGLVTGEPPRDAYRVEHVSGDELRRGS
jgi:general stress protein 26